MKVYQKIASLVKACENCVASGNTEWLERHSAGIEQIVRDLLPSGSGIDAGVMFNDEKSKENKLVFDFAYHHMNENGYYDGWTEHSLIVTPSLAFGFDMRITGRDRNAIKEYLADVFQYALDREIEYIDERWVEKKDS